MLDLTTKSIPQLLSYHAEILEELRRRDVVRSANNPTGDLAEYLFCAAFGWDQAANSEKSYDAVDSDGLRIQIKGRRLHRRNRSRQLSAMRDLSGFDVLAAVLFDDDYKILRAAMMSSDIVREHSRFTPHTNSFRFLLRDSIWQLPGVTDVTDSLRAVEQASAA
ncbi:MAG: hypothetical protein CMK07_09455 [Ponticaulis sp.]|nr:hypothetical protein [Ponticaulis sp.]